MIKERRIKGNGERERRIKRRGRRGNRRERKDRGRECRRIIKGSGESAGKKKEGRKERIKIRVMRR